jgi:rubrerythrin
MRKEGIRDLHVVPDVPARTELVCRTCGYGVAIVVPPAHCPICRASSWGIARGARHTAAEETWELP